MGRFAWKRRRRLPRLAVFICLALAALLLFYLAVQSLSGSSTREQKELLESAVMRAVMRCYALEGAYPESLRQLRDSYGLYYDEDLFFVDYRAVGANLLPDITVIELGGAEQ